NAYLPTSDGTAAIVALTPSHWRALAELMGDPAWAADERFADGASRALHWGELEPRLAEWCARQRGKELLARAQALGTPICCSFTLAETLFSEQRGAAGRAPP